MFSRIVPLLAILCVIIVAIMSFFLWREAEQEPNPASSARDVRLQNADLSREHMERAEQYARQAEAAALRAETLLETLLLVEARLAKTTSAEPEPTTTQEPQPATTEESQPAATQERQSQAAQESQPGATSAEAP